MRARRGNVLVLVAVSMVVLLGSGAMVVDIGMAYAERTRQQAAVDAGAMAAVYQLVPTVDVPAAKAAAVEWVGKNGYTISTSDVEVFDAAGGGKAVTVRSSSPSNTAFAGIFGLSKIPVSVDATATAAAVSQMPKGYMPFGVPAYRQSFGAGDPSGGPDDWFVRSADSNSYRLLTDDPDQGGPTQLVILASDSNKGNYQSLAIEGKGGKNYRNNINYGAEGPLELPSDVLSEPGKMVGPNEGLSDRIARMGEAGRNIIIPLISRADFEAGNGRSSYEVVGFVSAKIETLGKSKKDDEVTATFVSRVVPGKASNGPVNGAGVFTPKLIPTP